ncbi:hypothetical protein THAOC_34695, partial [Thalassiosira oceanica]
MCPIQGGDAQHASTIDPRPRTAHTDGDVPSADWQGCALCPPAATTIKRTPLSQGDGRPDDDDQDSSSAGAATSLVAVDTAQKKRGSGRGAKDGEAWPNSQGMVSGKSKRGRGCPPSRDGIVPVELKAPVPKRRQLPNRRIKMKGKIGSIRDTVQIHLVQKAGSPLMYRIREVVTVLATSLLNRPRARVSRAQPVSMSPWSARPYQNKRKSPSLPTTTDLLHQLATLCSPGTRWPRLSGDRVSEVMSITLEYGLYSGRVENDKPNARGKLLFEGVVLYGCHGGKKYNVIINGTFREGLLIYGKQVTACGDLLYEGNYKCVEADGS